MVGALEQDPRLPHIHIPMVSSLRGLNPFVAPTSLTPPPGPGGSSQSFKLVLDPSVVTHASVTLVILAIALIGGRTLSHLAGRAPVRLERRLARAGKTLDGERGLGHWLNRLTLVCIWIAAAFAITLTWFSEQTIKETGLNGKFLFSLAERIGGSLLVIACTLAVGRLLQRSLDDSLARRLNPNLTLLVGRVVFIATLAVGLVIVLAIWDTGVALSVTLIGAITVALSLALQDVLKNLVAGIYLLLERPFIIGDRITLSSYTGTIEDIEIRYTALRTEDGQRVIIPNSMLFSSPVINMSTAAIKRDGFTVTVPDSGSDTIERVEEHVLAALDSAPDVIKQPRPEIAVTSAAGGKVALQVVYWMPMTAPDKRAEVFTRVLESLRAELDSAELTTLDAASVS